MKAEWLHILAVAALTGGIALIIFAILTLARPFGGDLRVNPDAFELVLNTIEGRGRQYQLVESDSVIGYPPLWAG